MIHFDKMSHKARTDFLREWTTSDDAYITEKVDGLYFNFGQDAQGFFVGSRSSRKYSLEEIDSNVWYLNPWRTSLTAMKGLPFNEVLHYKETFHVECEYIPSYDYNIVQYSPSVVKNSGLFVVYSITVDGDKSIPVTKELISALNSIVPDEEVSFAENPIIAYQRDLPEHWTKTFLDLPQELMGSHYKNRIFRVWLQGYESMLGNLPTHRFVEGIVLHTPNYKAKVIDPYFTWYKDMNWDIISNIEMNLDALWKSLIRKSETTVIIYATDYISQSFKNDILASVNDTQLTIKRNVPRMVSENVDNKCSLPKKTQDSIKYGELTVARLEVLKALIVSAIDLEGIETAIQLWKKNKLDSCITTL